jgi:hypothetical protein
MAMAQLEELRKLKNSNHLIGTRTLNLPACSIVPQPSRLLHAQAKNRKQHNLYAHSTKK